MYAGGNLDAAQARGVYDDVHAALGAPPPLDARSPLAQCVQLPAGRAERRVPGRNANDENAACDLYWQIGVDAVATSARLGLLEHLMYEPLFDALRTKQQLGYTVQCSARNTQGVLGFLISVVSQSHTPSDIESRALYFVRDFVDGLRDQMPATEYAANVRAASANRLLADKAIEDEASRFWHELASRQYHFERAEAEAAAMRAISQADLAKWAREMLLSADSRRLCIAVQPPRGVAAEGAADDSNADTEAAPLASAQVTDPTAFAMGMPLHPRIERPPPEAASAKKL